MMRSLILMAAVALVSGFAVSVLAQGGPGGFVELHRAEIDDVEVVMGVIQREGESRTGRHTHPGGEFGLVLEGLLTLETEAEPTATLKPGASFYLPPGRWHSVSTGREGAKTVVFRLLPPDSPMVRPVE